MASTLTITTSVRSNIQGNVIQVANTEVVTRTGDAFIDNLQTIGATSEAVNFGDVTDPSRIYFKNFTEPVDAATDAGLHIYVGVATPCTALNATFALKPGEAVPVTTGQATWYALSQSGSQPLAVTAWQR
jgi:hypothetical protein